ncbi:hypothetical protein [Tabrizicola sp.]|uniref:hypothetical protein n=1 Tax=Tabrizicola sp. TaxID=2005166 RepID=UPI00261D5CCE|nr:hypothetical protein [Tabrizicola sp.]MDM7932935.1 hypothetical protein [Tabrizicola sp.]
MKRALLVIVLPFALLQACGPISVAEAERQCLERARLAKQPRGEVSVGLNSAGKVAGGLELNVSSDYILGRDPSAVFDSCVMGRSGELPSRPLSQQPGWR